MPDETDAVNDLATGDGLAINNHALPDHAPATMGELRALADKWEADRLDIVHRLIHIEDLLTEASPALVGMAAVFEQFGSMMAAGESAGVNLLARPGV